MHMELKMKMKMMMMMMMIMVMMMMMMAPVSQASDGQRVLEEPQRSLGLLHHWS